MGVEEMHDSFVVDIENLPPCTVEDNPPTVSRISVKLQRNLSSKGSPRGENRNKHTLSASSAFTDRCSTGPLTLGRQPQETITIMEENRLSNRKSFKHYNSFVDPRRVLLLFATLSSMGTLLLIYFTLSTCKFTGDSNTQS